MDLQKELWAPLQQQIKKYRQPKFFSAGLFLLISGYLAVHFPGGWVLCAAACAGAFSSKIGGRYPLAKWWQRFPLLSFVVPLLVIGATCWMADSYQGGSSLVSTVEYVSTAIAVLICLLVWLRPSFYLPMNFSVLSQNDSSTWLGIGAIIGAAEIFWLGWPYADLERSIWAMIVYPLIPSLLGAASVYFFFKKSRISYYLAGLVLVVSLGFNICQTAYWGWDNFQYHRLEKIVSKGTVQEVEAALSPKKLKDPTRQGNLLILAALREEPASFLVPLLENGADINQPNEIGERVLVMLSEKASPDMIAFLLEEGAEVNATNHYGLSALMQAVRNKQEKTVELLLKAGANPNLTTQDQPAAILQGRPTVEIFRQLITAGATVDKRDIAGNTALHWASAHGDEAAVTFLLKAGADVNAVNNTGNTPLLEAINHPSRPEVVRLLLAHGADPHVKNNFGYTAWAVLLDPRESLEQGMPRLPVAKMLIKAGVDVNREIDYGFTPLYFAKYYNHSGMEDRQQVIRLLEQHGAKETLPAKRKK